MDIYFVFLSLIRTFDLWPKVLSFGNSKKNIFFFGISLTYPYLCAEIRNYAFMKEYDIVCKVRVFQMDELGDEDRELVMAACLSTDASYSPYSRFRVGAAARLSNGVIFKGSNQENAAFPSGLCAERTALFAANAQYPEAMYKLWLLPREMIRALPWNRFRPVAHAAKSFWR